MIFRVDPLVGAKQPKAINRKYKPDSDVLKGAFVEFGLPNNARKPKPPIGIAMSTAIIFSATLIVLINRVILFLIITVLLALLQFLTSLIYNDWNLMRCFRGDNQELFYS